MNPFTAFIFTLFLGETLCARNLSQCPPATLINGRVRYRQRGRIARFLCNTGYMLAGDRYSICTGTKWDNVVSKCVRAGCKDPKPPLNGLIYPSYGGAVLNFYCKNGFELKGSNITYCDGVKWDNSLPSCLPSNSTPSLFCDFEEEHLCGWNHDLNHDFDWTRLNYATPSGSIGTGPSHDHTKGRGKDGYYMYIESSARNPNDHARLISPVYNKTNEIVCFEFYYHMYGSTTGSLRVYLRKITTSWAALNKPLFVKNGNQGDKWYRGFLELGVVENEFQIIIEGVRGPGYVSDMAIDDVKLIKSCVPENELMEAETTTEESNTSETPISVESCENRCNTNDTRNVNWLITCDCDEGCYERNRCCPDYFDYCVGVTTDDFMEETTEYDSTLAETTKRTTLTRVTPPPRRQTTSTTKKSPPTPKETPFPTTKKAVLLTTKKAPPTTKLTTTHFERKNESKIVYVKPTDSDIEEIPVTFSIKEKEISEEPIKETDVVSDYESDKSYDHQKIEVKSNIHESNMRTIIFSVGVVFGVLFAMVGMAFVAKRYQLCSCNGMRLNQSSNGDSQSDVRFLTGDEVLDFNLASDYDTL